MSESEGPGAGEQSPDDAFAHLFRPDPFGSSTPESADPVPDSPVVEEDEWEPLIPVPVAGGIDPELPPPAQPAEPVEPDEPVELVEENQRAPQLPPDPLAGRLFRSRGAPEVPEAITALGTMQARRLKTMARADEPQPMPEPVFDAEPALEPMSSAPLPVSSSGEPAPALSVMARPEAPAPAPSREERRAERNQASSGSLTGLGVYAVTTGVTVILAFGETLFFSDKPGTITGIGLLIVSVFAAFAVRTRDAINAIFAPAIAFFIAAITAGQVGLNANGLSGRAVEVFFLLGDNWVWIIGATVASLVIVALRRRLG